MNLPVPPLVLRRLVRDPIYAVGGPLVAALLVVLGALAWVLELPSRRKRGWRLLWTAAAAVVLDWAVFARCTLLWCAMPPGRRDPQLWRERNVRILREELQRFMQIADRLVGLDVRINAPTIPDDRPVLLLARHAGAGDSLLMVHVITDLLHRVPRVVLKRALLWDPAMDLCVRRLGGYFIGSGRRDRQRREAELRAFAESLQPGDMALLFPEGRNWTVGRHRAEVEAALAAGNSERAAWLERHPRVLSPRATGLRRILRAQPRIPVLVGGHQGLEDLASVRSIWRALPLDWPIHIDLIAVEPPSDEHVEQWLNDEWGRLDAWTDWLDGDD